jgi:RHS repeat-associated protein
VLELGDDAGIISYEEYFPFGATSYQAVAARTDLPKRYRYTAKERDEESDLYYHGARYYAPWLGRWTACDPIGISAGVNLYRYVQNAPTKFIDPTGTDEKHPNQSTRDNSPESPVTPTGEMGGYVHTIVELVLARRLTSIGFDVGIEIPTLPGGSKAWPPTNEKGSVDLGIFLPDKQNSNKYIADLIELKPKQKYAGVYQEFLAEVQHYVDYFPKSVGGRDISKARSGEVLKELYQNKSLREFVFSPVTIETPDEIATIKLDLAKVPSTEIDQPPWEPPGLVTYEISERSKRRDEKDRVEDQAQQESTWDRTVHIISPAPQDVSDIDQPGAGRGSYDPESPYLVPRVAPANDNAPEPANDNAPEDDSGRVTAKEANESAFVWGAVAVGAILLRYGWVLVL